MYVDDVLQLRVRTSTVISTRRHSPRSTRGCHSSVSRPATRRRPSPGRWTTSRCRPPTTMTTSSRTTSSCQAWRRTVTSSATSTSAASEWLTEELIDVRPRIASALSRFQADSSSTVCTPFQLSLLVDHPQNGVWCIISVVSLSVCQAFQSFVDVGSSYLYTSYISKEYGLSSCIKVIRSRSRSQEQK